MRILLGAMAALLLVTGCSHIPGIGNKAAASPSAAAEPTSASGAPLARADGQLDAEVPLPQGFPTDVPVYPKARLTAGASFASNGQAAFGLEWETTDAAGKVQAFYAKQLSAGDWMLAVIKSPANGEAYAATFSRKSNSHDTGTLALTSDAGVTLIALSLLSS